MYIYNERNELVSLEAATQQAQRAYDSGKAALYRPDGAPKYSEPEMRERLEKLQKEREEALTPYFDAAQRDVERHTRELGSIAGQDPADALTTEELQRATALEPYVSERLSQAPSGTLLDALRAAADSGERASIFVHLRLEEAESRAQRARLASSGSSNMFQHVYRS